MPHQFLLDVADKLAYANYKRARLKSPDLAPEAWKPIFGDDLDRYEAQLQREQESDDAR